MKLDPENAEAYLIMADLYEKTGEDEKAKEILEHGYEMTQDERMKEVQEKYQDKGRDGQEESGERENIGRLAEEDG